MSISKQLNQLQEIDIELESNEKALKEVASQLGNEEVVVGMRSKLDSERADLKKLVEQQRSVEWEIDGVNSKLAAIEDELYSGRTSNPKELTNLQHEADVVKAKRSQLEDNVLEVMEQVDVASGNVTAIEIELKKLEAEWQSQQKELSAELERLKSLVSRLQEKRQLLAKEIDPQTLEVYHELKKQKGIAVARVEQGICRGCRISLPVTELQRVKSGGLVRCGSCGRILYLA